MKLSYKAAARFAQSLSVVQLRLVVVAYAQGAPFAEVFPLLEQKAGDDVSLPPYLIKLKRLLEKKPRTIVELGKILEVRKDAVRTNLLSVNKKTGCWNWRCNNIEAAKRRSYQLFIADDNYRGKLEQTCGNELCVNPLHLEKAI